MISNINQVTGTEAGKKLLEIEYTVVNFLVSNIGDIIEGFKESIKAMKSLYGRKK